MSWDREEGALFVCIVMDYYPLGDLEICLRKKRENKEKFDELVLKKWIGQIIDAMTFVHEKVGLSLVLKHWRLKWPFYSVMSIVVLSTFT